MTKDNNEEVLVFLLEDSDQRFNKPLKIVVSRIFGGGSLDIRNRFYRVF